MALLPELMTVAEMNQDAVARWVRFEWRDSIHVGTLRADGGIAVCHGDIFDGAVPTGVVAPMADVRLLTPCVPKKFVALWNNFRALAAQTQQAIPQEPLYFIKASNSYLGSGSAIRRPEAYVGKVFFEGELGIVIGSRCKNASETEARAAIFGYTCVNDVTAQDVLFKDGSFAQWTRAKSYDTFGVFGPCIATGLDPSSLTVRTHVGGRERQNYPCSDMVFAPDELVRLVSHDMTLEPGDVIACGTSIGVGSLRSGVEVVVEIDGIGRLANTFHSEEAK